MCNQIKGVGRVVAHPEGNNKSPEERHRTAAKVHCSADTNQLQKLLEGPGFGLPLLSCLRHLEAILVC